MMDEQYTKALQEIEELKAERDAFKKQKNIAREMVLKLCDQTQWPNQQKKFNLYYVISLLKPIATVLSFQEEALNHKEEEKT